MWGVCWLISHGLEGLVTGEKGGHRQPRVMDKPACHATPREPTFHRIRKCQVEDYGKYTPEARR